ncbi:MAG: hypothetical protein ACI89L_001520 [Phycisphaerales bacterium]
MLSRYTRAMPTKPTTVKQYLDSLPADRREALGAIREVILANLDPAFEEGIQYGMIGYFVPHGVYPAGYHCDKTQPLPFVGLASNKNQMSIHLFCLYCDEGEKDRFVAAWAKTGKKLDMGKGCVRVKSLEGVPLDVLGKTIKRITAKRFIKAYEAGFGPEALAKRKTDRAASKSPAPKKPIKKPAAKKAATKSTAKKTRR